MVGDLVKDKSDAHLSIVISVDKWGWVVTVDSRGDTYDYDPDDARRHLKVINESR